MKYKIGDLIELSNDINFEIIRSNDRSYDKIKSIFAGKRADIVEIKDKEYVLCTYDGESYPNDNFYVIKCKNIKGKLIKNTKNTQRGAIYYNKDFFGYIGEDNQYVYVAHYTIYSEGKEALRKINKDKYYQNAVSICEFNYAEEHYNKEWGLIGKLID